MRGRGSVIFVALVVLGSALGYTASSFARDSAVEPSVSSGVPEPVTARSPHLPLDSPTPFEEDPDDPALTPGLPMEPAFLGTGDFRITFPVPQGWHPNARATNRAKWKKPHTSNNSYVMRLEQITSQEVSIDKAIDNREARLRKEQDDFERIDRGTDSLEYTYRSDENNARHSFMRWIDLDRDGQADVEIVVHGRHMDAPGARDLIGRIAAGVRLSRA